MLLNNQLNRHTADALCTVIALGFLELDNQNAERSNFVFEGNNAYYEHDALREIMLTRGINLFPVFEQQANKRNHPFIYARPNTIGGAIAQIDIDEAMHGFADDIEQICNMTFPGLNGAYIGGVADLAMVRLLVPSLLYQYQIPHYVNAQQAYLNDIRKYYGLFLDVTEKILDMFAALLENQADGDAIQIWATRDDLRAIVNRMPVNIINNHTLIASVHGLVTSMTTVPPHALEDNNFNIELSLSDGTNKVGSCMPCAIFAMSQGAPASYTHFGRGDYWNLPENCDDAIRYAWGAFVEDCYKAGMRILRGRIPVGWLNFFARLDIEVADGNVMYVPEAFLTALTFQSSFLSKMTNTLRQII